MAKRTLLEMVQEIGIRIGADEIDILDENTEARDIRFIIRQAYDEILSRRDWEFMRNEPRTLAAREVGDLQINRLKIPDDVSKLSINVVRYRNPTDARSNLFKELTYMSPLEFLDYVQREDENDANVDVITNPQGVPMLIRNDREPTYWTSFDERHVWFDSYDSNLGTGNQALDANILADGIPAMDWDTATATFPIPERMESLLFSEAVSIAQVALRQTGDPKAEAQSRRQYNKLRELEAATTRDTQEIDYGRRRR